MNASESDTTDAEFTRDAHKLLEEYRVDYRAFRHAAQLLAQHNCEMECLPPEYEEVLQEGRSILGDNRFATYVEIRWEEWNRS